VCYTHIVNIHLDPKYERQLEGLAVSAGKSVDEVLEELVRKGLEEAQQGGIQPNGRDAVEATKPHRSILELGGLGREVWEGVDPVQYINELRDDWD
jgi:hypothetical protein